MASKAHNGLKDWLLDQLASADLRALLVVGTEPDADDTFVSDITEHPDGVRVALTNVTVTRDDANDRASLTCDPIVFQVSATQQRSSDWRSTSILAMMQHQRSSSSMTRRT